VRQVLTILFSRPLSCRCARVATARFQARAHRHKVNQNPAISSSLLYPVF
jgi:hypothetical protein